ncbi:MAG: alanine racemase, partial [Candidatus Neomarinimicrobiota bacterium]
MRGPKAYIHLDHLVNNYHLVKNKVGQKRLVCVVKANAYGHGALECARTLYAAGCDYFAVFTVNEALDLRKGGINTEILVFNRLDENNLDLAVRRNLTLNISHIDDLNILFKYKKKTGNCPPLHLKIDTGMTRLGISAGEADTVLHKLALNRDINCLGIYSHLATADEGDLTFAYRQTEIFENIKNKALEFGLKFKYYHLSNSGAVLNLDQSNYNLVRVGMLLYGAFPSLEVERVMPFKPVME